MKMLKLTLSLLLCISFVASVSATDLIVEENAILPNFGSIQEAIDSANAGDRIFIKNKGQNIPWIETVTIDKPISLLALDTTSFFLLTGTINLAPDPAHFTDPDIQAINIIGAHINSGHIQTTDNGPAGTFVQANIFSNRLLSGNIEIDHQRYRSHVAGNLLQAGFVDIGYGVVSGNQVAGSIVITDISNATNDTTYVVGNRIINAAGNSNVGQIYWSTNENYMFIANNYVRRSQNATGALQIVSLLMNGPGTHMITNNTFESAGSNTYTYGIYISVGITGNTFMRIENNVFKDLQSGEFNDVGEHVIRLSTVALTSVVIANYNVYQNYGGSFLNGTFAAVYTLGNVESVSGTFDPDNTTGECSDPDCIDKGSDDIRHTDLDLTRNDCGTTGGSFHYDNFFPILTGGARVYLVKVPRTVIQGATINAEADGYDR